MSIKFNEISSSGISESDFNAIASAEIGHTKSIQIYRQNPVFSLHDDLALDSSYVWNAAVTGDYLAFIYRGASDHLHGKYLPTEDVDPSILSSWIDVDFGAIDSGSPVAVTSDGSVFYVYYLAGGFITRSSWSPPSGGFTSSATISTYAFSGVEWIGAIDDALGATAYVVIPDDQNNRRVYRVDASAITEIGINWPDELTGFSAHTITVNQEDTTGDFSDTDIRHVIAIASLFPNLYTEKLMDGQPHEVVVATGGLLSFVVRPEIGTRPIQVSYAQVVQGFDEVTSVQYRRANHLSAMNTVPQPDNPNDTLWLTAIGQNGDLNGADETFGFYALYYYSSRDGKFWSQDQIIPIEDIETDFNKYSAGFQLLSLGYYTYAVSNNKVLRSLGCGQFGNVHPTLTMDVSDRVNKYSSTASDFRQSTIELDNEDGYFYGTFLMSPGVFRLITKIGARKSSVNYLFQVSIEEIDSIEDPRERPRVLRVTSRDLMASLSDKVASVDAIQYDNIVIGKDTFDALGSATDSGLSHSDVVSGTFGTTDKAVTGATFNTLYIKSKYVNSVSFSTYKTSVASGSAQAEFNFPDPTINTSGATAEIAPTYSGVVFRGLDKDNYWFCRFNYWTAKIELGERRTGVDVVKSSYSPSGTFIANAVNSYVGIRVEFLYSRVRIWLCENVPSSLQYNFAFEYDVRANSQTIPAFGQGYTGVLGCGFSDEDQGTVEPEPIIVTTNSDFTDDVPARMIVLAASAGGFFRVRNIHNGSPAFENITPAWTSPNAVYCENDPHNNTRWLVMTTTEIWSCDNVWAVTPVWAKMCDSTTVGCEFLGMIKADIVNEGYFGWNGSGGPDNAYYAYTENNFASVHIVPLENLVQHVMYSVAIDTVDPNIIWLSGSRNASAFGGASNPKIYKSIDHGHSFSSYRFYYSPTNYVDDDHMGDVYTVFSMPGGSRAGVTGKVLKFHDSRLFANYNDGEWFHNQNDPGCSNATDNGWRGHDAINALTIDSAYVNVFGAGTLDYTSDAGLTWTRVVLGSGNNTNPFGVNGFPNNPNWLVCWTDAGIWLTSDRGATKTNIISAFYLVCGAPPLRVVADLSQWFTVPMR